MYGAVDAAITPIAPHHYIPILDASLKGGGEEIKTCHTTAVVIVVAMDVDRMKRLQAFQPFGNPPDSMWRPPKLRT